MQLRATVSIGTGINANCASQNYYQNSGQVRRDGERSAVWRKVLTNEDRLCSLNKVEGLKVGENNFCECLCKL